MMPYDATKERRFEEAIAGARKKRGEGDYAQVKMLLNEAKQAIDSLPLPKNIQESVEYLRLSHNSYKRLLEFSDSIPLTGGLKESIISLVKVIGLEVPIPQEVESAEKLEEIVTNCTNHLKELMAG